MRSAALWVAALSTGGEIVTSEIAELGRGKLDLSVQRSPDDEVNGELGFRFVRALAVEKAALDANLSPAAVRVLAAILYFMNNTTKRAWPSYERIHEITGYSRDTIERAIRQLIGSGYLFRERKAPITGGRALVHYGLRALHPSHIDRMISVAVEEFRRQRPAPEADPVKNSGVRLTQGNTAGSTADPSIFAASDPGIFVRQEPYKNEPVFSLSETPVSNYELRRQPKSWFVYTEEFESFWGQYPDIRNNSKSCAFDEWRKLSSEDRAAAVAALGGFGRYCRTNPDYRCVHAERFIRERRFEGYATSAQDRARTADENASAKVPRMPSRWGRT